MMRFTAETAMLAWMLRLGALALLTAWIGHDPATLPAANAPAMAAAPWLASTMLLISALPRRADQPRRRRPT